MFSKITRLFQSDTEEPQSNESQSKQPQSPVITFEGASLPVTEGVSVLETLEAAGYQIPNSCRSGVCHSCMMQGDDNVPEDAQQGLSASQVAQNYFLACSCFPVEDLSVSLKGTADMAQGKVVEKKLLNQSVLALFIQVDFRWFPGQYLTVWKDELEGRPYSIASRCDNTKVIELHIQRHDQGIVSRWAHDELAVDDTVMLSHAVGDCFYTDDHHDKPILMACTGTGLAPLYGIVREALEQKHTAPIYLYAASGEPEGLYYRDELTALALQYDNFSYIPAVRRNATEGLIEQDVVELVKERHPELNGHKVFICGAPEAVKQIQRNCFFQGAKVVDILVDSFEIATPAKDAEKSD